MLNCTSTSPWWSSLSDSMSLRYDTVQLNRIEWMLSPLMMKLSASDDTLKLFELSGFDVPDPRVSGPSDAEVIDKGSVSKSKQRCMRVAQTKRRMWSRNQECVVENIKDDCELTSETLRGDTSSMMKALFQKLVDVETKAKGVSAVAEEASERACHAMAVAESSDSKITCGTDEPAVAVDMGFLESLRGQRKEDVVLNLFLNRDLEPNTVKGTLDDMERYFETELAKLGSFLSMKFGIPECSWPGLRSRLLEEVLRNRAWHQGCTLGALLKDMREQRSNNKAHSTERSRHLTDELVKPRRKKRHK